MTHKKEKTTLQKWSRRAFIGVGGLAGAGLVVGVGGYAWLTKNARRFSGKGFAVGDNILNAWVSIAPNNQITIAVPRAEMGQGVYTAVPMMIAEELNLTDLKLVKIFHPQPEPAYTGTYPQTHQLKASDGSLTFMEKVMHAVPTVATGGSSTIFDGWYQMRHAGAVALNMLKKAAAKRWDIDENDLIAEDGFISNTRNNEKFTYGELAEESKSFKVDKAPPLKAKKDRKLMGTSPQRFDIPEKVNGKAIYGIDVRKENLLFGATKLASFQDGVVESISNQDEIENMKGVKKVVMLEKGKGVVVIADNSWRAQNAANALELKETGNNKFSTEEAERQASDILENNKILANIRTKGNAAKILDDAEAIVEATYQLPYLAHACMEPQNATVLGKDGKADIWVGTQTPGVAQEAVAKATGLSKSDVTVNVTYLGGGFGRRLEGDFASYAAQAANAVPDTPVQVLFSREECMKNDVYRPYSKAYMRAKLKDDGIEAFEYRLAIESASEKALMRLKPILAPEPQEDQTSMGEGFSDQAYQYDNELLALGENMDTPVELGFWRSVGYSQGGFYYESFIDECAHAAGKDPLKFRKQILSESPRYIKVLDKVAEMSNWYNPAEGRYLGLSIHKAFFTIVAEVVELSKVSEKEFKLNKVYAVVDCGQYVHPGIIKSNIRGGINFGLTATLHGEVTFKNGVVEQTNFPTYDMIRLDVAPEIDVHIMENDEFPGGIGEPSVPPIFAAVTNAIFAATGDRVRSLPLAKHGYKFV